MGRRLALEPRTKRFKQPWRYDDAVCLADCALMLRERLVDGSISMLTLM